MRWTRWRRRLGFRGVWVRVGWLARAPLGLLGLDWVAAGRVVPMGAATLREKTEQSPGRQPQREPKLAALPSTLGLAEQARLVRRVQPSYRSV